MCVCVCEGVVRKEMWEEKGMWVKEEVICLGFGKIDSNSAFELKLRFQRTQQTKSHISAKPT